MQITLIRKAKSLLHSPNEGEYKMKLYAFNIKVYTGFSKRFNFWSNSDEEALKVIKKFWREYDLPIEKCKWTLSKAVERLIVQNFIEWEIIKKNDIPFEVTLNAYEDIMKKSYPSYKGRND